MTTKEIIELVEFELKSVEWGRTEQFLEIHSPALCGDKVQIDNIVTNGNKISVFIPVQNERFYLVINIDSNGKEIVGISTEPYVAIYFKATSTELSVDVLKRYSNLEITESWNKGDKKPYGISIYNFSCIIEPNKRPNNFETKFNELISELKKDKLGIPNLSNVADVYIQVAMDFHNGNGMIGGPNLNEENIRDLNDLSLSINFDLYVSGNLYKS